MGKMVGGFTSPLFFFFWEDFGKGRESFTRGGGGGGGGGIVLCGWFGRGRVWGLFVMIMMILILE